MCGNSAVCLCVVLYRVEMCVWLFRCVCVYMSICSGVEEPELVLSLRQSAIKQEKEDECRTERETRSEEAVTRKVEETEEEKRELQADADVTLDFTNAGKHANVSVKETTPE